MIEIKNRYDGAVVFRSETAETLKEAVREAIETDADLRDSDLRDSDLRGSNLSGSNLSYSNLRGSNLRGSDLRDSDLRDSDLSGSNLSGSNLSYSNLRGSNLRGSDLSYSDLSYSDLRDSDLRGSNLSGSNLSGSNLSGSNLSGSNLSYSNLRSLAERIAERDAARLRHPRVPVVENLDSVILAEIRSGATLDMAQWHLCETTHCRAGWAIHKAGEAGRALETRLGPFVAGRLIYLVSTGHRPDFFASNADAMADLEARAAEQGPV